MPGHAQPFSEAHEVSALVGLPPALRDLVDLLARRRRPRANEDWLPLIATANSCWLGPALSAALEGVPAGTVPEDVRDYLGIIAGMNRARSAAQHAQLLEAAGTLSAAGITPILGKGTALLFTSADGDPDVRMMGDLDLAVAQEERVPARQALEAAGYAVWRAPNEDSDVLFRPTDPGPIELHSPTPGHPAYALLDRLAIEPEAVTRNGIMVLIPPPTVRLLHLVLHDEIRDGGLYRGSFDLRHLFDGARLLASGRVDGTALRTAPESRDEKRAVAEWLLLVALLTGVDGPVDPPSDDVRRSVDRRLMQTGHGIAPASIRLMRRGRWLLERIRRGETSPFHGFRRLLPSNNAEDGEEQPIRALGYGPRIG
jgi:hypothetical protein